MKTIQITIDPELLHKIDNDEDSIKKNRSAFLRQVVRYYFEQKRYFTMSVYASTISGRMGIQQRFNSIFRKVWGSRLRGIKGSSDGNHNKPLLESLTPGILESLG